MREFCVEVSQEQREYAVRLVNACNFAKRGRFDGSKLKQCAGILAQVVVGDLLGLPRPEQSEGSDGGIDFMVYDKGIDLKTMLMSVDPKPYMVNNLSALQVDDHHETDVYLFACANKTTGMLFLRGWLKKTELDRHWLLFKGTPRPRSDGTSFELYCDTYEIPQKALHPFGSPEKFLSDMTMFGV